MRGLPDKYRSVEADQVLVLGQRLEQLTHFAADMLGVAEGVPAFGDPHGTELPGPPVHVLKKMPGNGAIVPDAHAAGRQWLDEPLGGGLRLKEVQCRLGSQARAIFKDR